MLLAVHINIPAFLPYLSLNLKAMIHQIIFMFILI